MKTVIQALVASMFVLPSFASAQVQPTDDEIVAACEKRYKAPIAREFCIQSAKLVLLEQRLKRGETTLKAEVARLRQELEATRPLPPSQEEARKWVEERAGEIHAREKKAQHPPRSPLVEGGRTPPSVGYVGVPHQVVSAPGQYAAATFDPGGPRLVLQHLGWGADKHARGATQVRVVVKKNGRAIPVAHAVPAVPFEMFYADLDGNGRPDRTPYKGLDPLAQDEVHIALVGPRDHIELVYLVDSGKRVLVPGLPPQILWVRTQRVEYTAPDRVGRWGQDAHGGWPLNL